MLNVSYQDCHIVAMAKLFESIGKLGLALAIGGGVVNSALFNGKFYILYVLCKLKTVLH